MQFRITFQGDIANIGLCLRRILPMLNRYSDFMSELVHLVILFGIVQHHNYSKLLAMNNETSTM